MQQMTANSKPLTAPRSSWSKDVHMILYTIWGWSHLTALGADCQMTHSWVNFPGVLNDDWNGQVDVVRVHQANSEACEARKGPMHRPLSQHLQQQQLL